MVKGKTLKEKRNLSILIVPHSSGVVKTIRITSFTRKLCAIIAFIVVSLSCAAVYTSTLLNENDSLRAQVQELTNVSLNQRKMINEKVNQINELKETQRTVDNIIDDFTKKYRQITESYISRGVENSRSGRVDTANGQSFAKELQELRNLLQDLSNFNSSTDDTSIKLSEAEEELKAYLDSLPTLFPTVGRISDNFGYRMHPIYGRRIFHEGLDIGASHGSDIKAAGTGKVVFSGTRGGYGLLVEIDHGNGITSRYGHCSKLLVKPGDTVNRGDVVAKIGSTGASTGPHLHFEVRLNGTPVNPLQFLNH